MSIVQLPNPDTGLFQIVLPEQATVAQKALTEKIDGLLESLKQRQSKGELCDVGRCRPRWSDRWMHLPSARLATGRDYSRCELPVEIGP